MFLIKPLLLLIIGTVFLVGCSSNYHVDLDKFCEDNIEELDCEQLLKCDINCNNLDIGTHVLFCHSSFTNQIIAKCK